MTPIDLHGHALSGASAAAREHYERALGLFRLYSGDPLADAEAALADSPGFVMAHVLKAWLNLLGTEPAGVAGRARGATPPPRRLPAPTREQRPSRRRRPPRRRALARGEPRAAGGPRASTIRATCWRCRPATRSTSSPAMPACCATASRARWPTGRRTCRAITRVLGMHAFGLEETGDYARAESRGPPRRRARAARRLGAARGGARDGDAGPHARRHRLDARQSARPGRRDSFFAVHNWWHLALFHLDLGEIDEVLRAVRRADLRRALGAGARHDRRLGAAVAAAPARRRRRRPLGRAGRQLGSRSRGAATMPSTTRTR